MNNDTKILAKNKRAFYEYEIIETLECGIALQGSEVKSIKEKNLNLSDAYSRIKMLNNNKMQLLLQNMHVAPYKFDTFNSFEPKRNRILLANKKEIIKLKKKTEQKGMTLVPISIYLKKSRVKVEIALAKGKKLYDKRESLKRKEDNRRLDKELKNRMH